MQPPSSGWGDPRQTHISVFMWTLPSGPGLQAELLAHFTDEAAEFQGLSKVAGLAGGGSRTS